MQIESKHRFENIGSTERRMNRKMRRNQLERLEKPSCQRYYIVHTVYQEVCSSINSYHVRVERMISIDKIVQSMWCEMVYKYTNAPAQAHLHTRIFGADFRITCSWLFTNIVQCSQVFMYLHKSTSSLRLTTERQMEKNQSNHRTKELVEKKNEMTKYIRE